MVVVMIKIRDKKKFQKSNGWEKSRLKCQLCMPHLRMQLCMTPSYTVCCFRSHGTFSTVGNFPSKGSINFFLNVKFPQIALWFSIVTKKWLSERFMSYNVLSAIFRPLSKKQIGSPYCIIRKP